MKVIYRRCAGLDVHEKSVFVCARILRGKQLEIIEATFPTFTEDLEALRAWLIKHRIQRVAMESTGVYWRPVWNILEQSKLDLILLNPFHVKALPGHKTDRVDAARIAELVQYDLVRASFVPPVEIRELRDLCGGGCTSLRIATVSRIAFIDCSNSRTSSCPAYSAK